MTRLTDVAQETLKDAKWILENPSLAAKLTDLIGTPIEAAIKKLPPKAMATIQTATEGALMKSADAALATMGAPAQAEAHTKLHKLAAAAVLAPTAIAKPVLPELSAQPALAHAGEEEEPVAQQKEPVPYDGCPCSPYSL